MRVVCSLEQTQSAMYVLLELYFSKYRFQTILWYSYLHQGLIFSKTDKITEQISQLPQSSGVYEWPGIIVEFSSQLNL